MFSNYIFVGLEIFVYIYIYNPESQFSDFYLNVLNTSNASYLIFTPCLFKVKRKMERIKIKSPFATNGMSFI